MAPIIKHCTAHVDTDWSALPEPFHVCAVSAARGRPRWYGADDTREWFDNDAGARAYAERRWPGCRFLLHAMGWFEHWTGPADVIAITVVDLGGKPVGEGPVVGWIFGGVFKTPPTSPPCTLDGHIPFDMAVWHDAMGLPAAPVMKPQRMEMATLLPLPTDEQGRLLEHVTHLMPLEDLVLPRATRSAVERLLAEHRQAVPPSAPPQAMPGPMQPIGAVGHLL